MAYKQHCNVKIYISRMFRLLMYEVLAQLGKHTLMRQNILQGVLIFTCAVKDAPKDITDEP